MILLTSIIAYGLLSSALLIKFESCLEAPINWTKYTLLGVGFLIVAGFYMLYKMYIHRLSRIEGLESFGFISIFAFMLLMFVFGINRNFIKESLKYFWKAK